MRGDREREPHAQRASDTVDDASGDAYEVRSGRSHGEVVPPATAEDPLEDGDLIGRFRVLRRLGAGGMGVVYEARDDQLGRSVAIKLLHERHASRSRPRILREARAMARVAHPNVVQVFEIGEHGQRVFVAMELVVGKTLRAWQEGDGRRLGWREVVAMYVQAGWGLVAVHRAGLVHRDFKPDNVLVGEDGRARVLDFGLVRGRGTGAEPSSGDPSQVVEPPSGDFGRTLTHAGTRLGTPLYMSPEQHLGLPADARSDQFSFCVALYEALHGVRPFAGESLELLAMAVTRGRVLPPGRRVPRWLHRAVIRGLAPDPAARWPSLEALVDRLETEPGRRARRAIYGLVGVGLAGALALGARGDGEPPCTGAAEALAGTWSAARRDAVVEAMRATRLPYAEASAREVTAQLDRYGEAWQALHEQTCHAHRRGELSDGGLELGMQCLERRRAQLDALAGVLEEATVEVVERSVMGASSLPSLRGCRELDALRRAGALPEEPERAATVRALQARLAVVEALGQTGRLSDGLGRLAALGPELEAAGHRPLLAEAALVEGTLAMALEDVERAERSLARALAEAEALGLDELSARAIGAQLQLAAQRRERLDEARPWVPLARAKLERIGALGTLEHARLLAEIGGFHFVAGEYDAAEDAFERCHEVLAGVEDPGHSTHVSCGAGLAGVQSARGNLMAASERFEALRDVLAKVVGEEHPRVQVLDNNLGMLRFGLGQYEDALVVHRRALESARRLFGPDDPRVAQSLTHIGHALREQGRLDEAEEAYRSALRVQDGLEGEYEANIHEGLGLLESARGHGERALEHQRRTRELRARALGEDHPHVGWAELQLGETLHALGRLDEARARLAKGVEIFERRIDRRHPQVVAALERLGRIALDQGHAHEAVERLERALEILDEAAAHGELQGHEAFRHTTPYHLARALWLAGGDRARGAELLRRALDGAEADPERRAEIERWLAEDPERRALVEP